MSDPAASDHPSPHRFKVGSGRMSFGLFAAPVAWALQMLLSQSLASYACYPDKFPLKEPQWPWLSAAMAGIALLAFAVATASMLTAWISWHRVSGEKAESGHAVDGGEGRTRFLAALALLTNFLFLSAILFTGCAVLLVSPCSSWF